MLLSIVIPSTHIAQYKMALQEVVDEERQLGYSQLSDGTTSRLAKLYMVPLRGSLYIFHLAMGITGLGLMVYSAFLYVTYHRTGYKPGPPSPGPAVDNSVAGDSVMAQDRDGMFDPEPEPIPDRCPWSLCIIGGLGAAMFSVGCSGFFSVKGEARQGMAVANALLVGTMLGQVALLLFLFTDNSWRHDLPVDPSGWWEVFSQYVDAHGRLVKLTSLTILLTEFLGLVMSFWLHSIYQSEYEEWLDNVKDRENRARDILGRAAEESYARGAESGWNARTKDRYGIESFKLQENTQAIHQTSRLTEDE